MKVNDFVFHEFELKQITKIENGNITDLTDGYFHINGNNLNFFCFELNIKVKVISDVYKNIYDKIHKFKVNGLNYPEIHGYLVHEWSKCCECVFENLDAFDGNSIKNTKSEKIRAENIEDNLLNIEKWYNELESYVNQTVKDKKIGGVKIFQSSNRS